jgi:hypothetical protein
MQEAHYPRVLLSPFRMLRKPFIRVCPSCIYTVRWAQLIFRYGSALSPLNLFNSLPCAFLFPSTIHTTLSLSSSLFTLLPFPSQFHFALLSHSSYLTPPPSAVLPVLVHHLLPIVVLIFIVLVSDHPPTFLSLNFSFDLHHNTPSCDHPLLRNPSSLCRSHFHWPPLWSPS